MATELLVDDRLTIPASALRVQYSRSGGPGGQHVNTAETRVQLFFAVDACPGLSYAARRRLREAQGSRINKDGELVLACDAHRVRSRNLDLVRARLVELVRASLVAPRVRRATRPSKGAKERRLKAKGRRSQTKAMRKVPSEG
jgi:ribosome-associated protein